MEEPKPLTPIFDCLNFLLKYERESGDGMSPVAIKLGRVQRALLNAEKRSARGWMEIRSPSRDTQTHRMGTYSGLPVYVVDDQSLIEIVLEKDAVEEE